MNSIPKKTQVKFIIYDLLFLSCFSFSEFVLLIPSSNMNDSYLGNISEASESSKMVKFRQYAIQLDQMEIEDALAAQWARLEISDSAAFQSELELQAHFFSDPNSPTMADDIPYISRLCDQNNIPFASNVATAEMLVLGLDRGDLDWRNILYPGRSPFTA